MANCTVIRLKGCQIFKGLLDRSNQAAVLDDIRLIVSKAPLFSPLTPWGRQMSVRMTSAGRFGWYSDHTGYRYITNHPSGSEWPEIPKSIRTIWHDLCAGHPDPECCLVNYYTKEARMGLHQDKDEKHFKHPVLSISLGDDALFRIGGQNKSDPTESIWLLSGDVLVMSGPNRLAYHGIDRIKFGSSQLLKSGGRLNLTLRVVE